MKSHPTKHIMRQRYDSTLYLVRNKRGCYLILKGFKGFNVTKGSATSNSIHLIYHHYKRTHTLLMKQIMFPFKLK